MQFVISLKFSNLFDCSIYSAVIVINNVFPIPPESCDGGHSAEKREPHRSNGKNAVAGQLMTRESHYWQLCS